MARDRVLALILAGGQGSRMDVLTRERAKPAMPFAGIYRLLDFPLSNLHHAGIDDVWLSVQYQSHSIGDEIANGRPWDLDRTRGGLRILAPQQGVGSVEDGLASGNADVLFPARSAPVPASSRRRCSSTGRPCSSRRWRHCTASFRLTSRAGRVSATSATICCRDWSTAERCTSTACRATGETSGDPRHTSRPTATCSSARSGCSTIRAGPSSRATCSGRRLVS